MTKLIAKKSNERIDKYLAEKTEYSRALIAKMLSDEKITVNNKVVKASYKVSENDVIEYPEDFVQPVTIEAEDIPLDIIYEDKDIIVINKPSGLIVHPGSGAKSGTLVNALMAHTNNLSDAGGELRYGIVHRLDKDTSGLMIVAKNNKVHNILADNFKNKTIKREYIALLSGVFPHESATIDAPIGRDKINREKMTVTATNSKNAISYLKVLKKYAEYTLVSFILETGRTHQIRVHAKYIGYPIYNDPLYNNGDNEFGQFLHSAKLEFNHPITNKPLKFECPLPKEFQDFLDKIEEVKLY